MAGIVGGQTAWAQILAPPATGCVTLTSHLLSLSLSFLVYKMGMINTASQKARMWHLDP